MNFKQYMNQAGSTLIGIMFAAAAIGGIGFLASKRFQTDMKMAKSIEVKNDYETILSQIKIILSNSESCRYTFTQQGDWYPDDYLKRNSVNIYEKKDASSLPVIRFQSNVNPASAVRYGKSQVRISYVMLGNRADPTAYYDATNPTSGYANLLIGFYFNDNKSGTQELEKKIRLRISTVSDIDRRITSCSTAADSSLDIYLALTGGEVEGSIIMSSGTNIQFLSDRRFKYKIKNIGPVLNDFAKISPVLFRWKTTGLDQYGFIAQDLQKIFPDLVEMHKGSYLTVDYIHLAPYLVKGFQELEQENLALRKRFSKLKKEHDEIKKYLCRKSNKFSQCGE